MNPEKYREKLEALRGKPVSVFITAVPFNIQGVVQWGLLPGQPFGVRVEGEKGKAQITLDPARIIHIESRQHQTLIYLNY